jgi:hypothetical protein
MPERCATKAKPQIIAESVKIHVDLTALFIVKSPPIPYEATEKVGIGRRTHGDGSFV